MKYYYENEISDIFKNQQDIRCADSVNWSSGTLKVTFGVLEIDCWQVGSPECTFTTPVGHDLNSRTIKCSVSGYVIDYIEISSAWKCSHSQSKNKLLKKRNALGSFCELFFTVMMNFTNSKLMMYNDPRYAL